ncbi:alpha-1,4-glucan--maltose-1-phosphate maltosyltransferase [Rhizobium helianthi]|uniref:Alpha-1,4-glucan:maltose-1-phosphate maltosyltransferase n=1 Tax=Rhizobium helianthi TaxID=1132695 RepID=A0ABW4M0R4_9HYPH
MHSDPAIHAQSMTPSPLNPRIYYVHPLMLRGIEAWRDLFRHARDLGFDTVLSAPLSQRVGGASLFVSSDPDRTDPALELPENLFDAIRLLCEAARAERLDFMLDVVVDRRPLSNAAVARPLSDPRISPLAAKSELLQDAPPQDRDNHFHDWENRIRNLAEAGTAGFRCLGLDRVPRDVWLRLKAACGDAHFLAWTPGTDFALRRTLAGGIFEACFSSLAWWDMQERWFLEEYEIQRGYGTQITFPEVPFAKRLAHGIDSVEIRERRARQRLFLADRLGQGLMIPMGFEFGASSPLDPTYGSGDGLRGLRVQGCYDLCGDIRALNAQATADPPQQAPYLRLVSTGQGTVVSLLQSQQEDLRNARKVRIIVLNRDERRSSAAPMSSLREAASAFLPLRQADNENREVAASLRLQPAELRILEGETSPVITGAVEVSDAATAAAGARLAIENITPCVDGGRFPVKRIVGETVVVEADLFGDGHDPISAALFWHAADEEAWEEVPMRMVENDRWTAEFTPRRMGRHEFAIETWRNPFQIFRYEFGKKHDARLDLNLEIQEGILLVQSALALADERVKPDLETLRQALESANVEERIALLLKPETSALMARADRRPHRARSAPVPLDAERKEAAFASWYQIFPRSQSGDPNRHGTFDDVIQRLPAIRDMGFDVLYFPPIHPIGTTNRKGRNNSLKAGPNDPGSPYGIGSEAGGHDAIHPELGTFEDFRRLVAAARQHGLEIALDLAIQASPDHPWLKDHPGWFDWRPDGTVRYAENPPKKYEDIVNVDFYAKDAVPSLWIELRDIVQKWVDQGVKLFRVDNPHTKPFPFWEWLIADIRNRHPEVVFLSEAFTRPKVMYRLAKIGFSQSYTYFTWRNTKWELETYMRELTQDEPREFFRPHFFVNTHDINPDFLQDAPRPAYLIRAALASTLSGLWGVYNGFELCEGRPDAKRKEYADSEKYEIRAWDYDRPGNIKAEIAMLNRIRRENPALHSHLGLRQLIAWNDNIIFFEKASPTRDNVLLVGVNLDPHAAQEADVEIPLWAWNLPDHGTLNLEDLIGGQKFSLTGKWQRLRLEPHMPFSIWRVR